ncbi:MAG: sugar kinase [Candidatus Izemoplasmatales bacterium]
MSNEKLDHKLILVTRKTRLAELVAKYNTVDQAKFYLEHMGIDFDDYLIEDRNYRDSLQECLSILNSKGKVLQLDRTFLPNYVFHESDLIVVLGQDGLVANTLKYLDSQKVIAVNPDPSRWDGVLLPFRVSQLEKIIDETIKGFRKYKEITMAKAILNDGQVLYGVNDLFIGHKSHVSSKYLININGKTESQSSSGIIVSTGLGSTGWLKSIIEGAAGIMKSLAKLDIDRNLIEMKWDSDYLYYSIREPYKSIRTDSSIVFGHIERNEHLTIESRMPQDGRIFSDGVEEDFIEFNSGAIVKIIVAEKKGKLII